MPKLTYAVLIAGLCASSAHAAETTVNRPKVYSDIVACRALADAAARLQCYDAASKSLEEATESRQVVLLDQGDVRKTKRSLFGFSLPKIPFFGESDEEQDEEYKQIEARSTVFKHLATVGISLRQKTRAHGKPPKAVGSF